jgi:hypothetical protein
MAAGVVRTSAALATHAVSALARVLGRASRARPRLAIDASDRLAEMTSGG